MNRPVQIFTTEDIRLERRLPTYWRVTFDMPPVNIFGPKHLPLLNDIITAIETDPDVKVVVFDSAVEGFFITHYDFLAPLEDSLRVPPGPTGLQALPDMLVRLSRAPVVSIASIRGRATGVGSELALASDMALCQPREGDPVAMGGRRGTRARRRTDGPVAAADGPRPRARSVARCR